MSAFQRWGAPASRSCAHLRTFLLPWRSGLVRQATPENSTCPAANKSHLLVFADSCFCESSKESLCFLPTEDGSEHKIFVWTAPLRESG